MRMVTPAVRHDHPEESASRSTRSRTDGPTDGATRAVRVARPVRATRPVRALRAQAPGASMTMRNPAGGSPTTTARQSTRGRPARLRTFRRLARRERPMHGPPDDAPSRMCWAPGRGSEHLLANDGKCLLTLHRGICGVQQARPVALTTIGCHRAAAVE